MVTVTFQARTIEELNQKISDFQTFGGTVEETPNHMPLIIDAVRSGDWSKVDG